MPRGKKKVEPTVLVSVDLKRNWHQGKSTDNPFYEVHLEGRDYLVMYYGVCLINRSKSLEEAISFISERMSKH